MISIRGQIKKFDPDSSAHFRLRIVSQTIIETEKEKIFFVFSLKAFEDLKSP
jgi:hypothetical protein